LSQDRPLKAVKLAEDLHAAGKPVLGGVSEDSETEASAHLFKVAQTWKPAIEALREMAVGRRIVIINEHHAVQRHRAFASQLIDGLADDGFTLFAGEALGMDIADTMADGVPDTATGFYTAEPLYADLLRRLAARDVALFAYEIRPEQREKGELTDLQRVTNREQAQAENLAAVLASHPTMRLMIYCGGAHGAETPQQEGTLWMGGRLKQLTDLDPLTIDQMGGALPATDEDRRPDANELVAFDASGVPLGKSGSDVSVWHRSVPDVDGRPGWMAMGGYRRPIPITMPADGQRTLLRAFVASEPELAIAMDQTLVAPSSTSATLMLPVGRYRLVREWADGTQRVLSDSHLVSDPTP